MLWNKFWNCVDCIISIMVFSVMITGCDHRSQGDDQGIALWIDNTPISVAEMKNSVKTKVKTWALDGEIGEEDFDRVVESWVEDLRMERVIREEARRAGYTVRNFKEEIPEKMVESYPEGFEFAERNEMEWWNKVSSGVELMELTAQIVEDLTKDIEVSEEVLNAEYMRRIEFYTLPESLEVQVIRVYDSELAQELHKKLLRQWKFETLAQKHSNLNGDGSYGETIRKNVGEFSREIEPELLAMKAGDISRVFVSQEGYFIYKLVKKHPSQILPFETVRDKVSEDWLIAQKSLIFREWLESEMQKIDVRYGTPLPYWGDTK
jgi:parvulin-like peptidyl-prolyl isomerase